MVNIIKQLKKFVILQIAITLFIVIFFTPTILGNQITPKTEQPQIIQTNPGGFVWPLPGYTRISSPFGKRVSPTTGASSSHSGMDIPAPPGTKFIAVHDGTITFREFLGAGGYTITLSFDNFKVSYCHCDPNFIVEVGQEVKQGQVIRMRRTKERIWS
ncbi:MAG: M23 family metallopeptidase [Clostridia bacterium]|nr:M23 family metallopeptidase [Clostridia bacterium]